jgi:glycosyltransferase involved in cell wall biosynthesis
MTEAGARPDAPHVVMLVANDIATDTRVKKEALALAAMGLRVTLVGAASERTQRLSRLGSVDIVRLDVPFPRRTKRDQARQRRRERRLRLIGPTEHRQDEPDATGARLVRRKMVSALIVGRRKGERQLDRTLRKVWARYDTRVAGNTRVARWQRVLPEVDDYEDAFAPAIDRLAPDIIHAHDMHMLRVASRAADRARSRGRTVRWVYDAHEYVPGLSTYGSRTPRTVAAWAKLEADYIGNADRVITVGPAIADALRDHYGLSHRPVVVLNTPVIEPPTAERLPSIREVAGVPDGVPLLVYSGAVTSARGVHVLVDALPLIPDAHVAVVCVPHADLPYPRGIQRAAVRLGVADRLHLLEPVRPGQVVEFLRGADIGVIPILPFPSHEMALPNKVFEYLHAGLPVVVTELTTLGPFVREHGIGEAFPAGDAAGLARAVSAVRADRDRYTRNARDPELLERYSWGRQEHALAELYAELLGIPDLADRVRFGDDRVMDLTEQALGQPG